MGLYMKIVLSSIFMVCSMTVNFPCMIATLAPYYIASAGYCYLLKIGSHTIAPVSTAIGEALMQSGDMKHSSLSLRNYLDK